MHSFDEYLDMQRGEFEYLQIACVLIVRSAVVAVVVVAAVLVAEAAVLVQTCPP